LKSLLLLWKRLALECASQCCTCATHDCKTVMRRTEHEGLSFLTITLPTFGKDLEKGLDRGSVDHDLFQGFSWRGGLPKFLWGFLDHVFDRTSGVLLDDPSIDAIRSIRQLTLMFGKLRVPCTPERERRAFDAYIQCEQDVRESDRSISSLQWEEFDRMSLMLFGRTFLSIDRKIYNGELLPVKHGPGKTADGISSNAKFRLTKWTERLEKGYFPFGEFCLPNWSYYPVLDDVDILEPGSEIPVKVVSVPKTLKTPRIIAMEPAAMMYAQQSLLHEFRVAISRSNYLRRMIGLEDQDPNREMAHQGSLNGDLATLDLSEASDRVSNQHVRHMLQRFPSLSEAVDACRSRKADVPGHGVKRLAKFASMGSALCFPMEAMVFLTLIFIGIQRSLNTSLTLKDVQSLKESVRVFGDDLIVPVDHVHSVISVLQDFGLVVNTGKSFWTGRFRESCGKEYYAGEDVSIVRCRRNFPSSPRHAPEVISLVELRNHFYWSGYWSTCQWLDERIREVIRHFPMVLSTSPVLGRQSVLGFHTQKIGEHLHNPMVKGYVVAATSPNDKLDDHGALLKYFLKSGDDPFFDENHLERAGRPALVRIKRGWSSAI